jgi:hypothetical protein
MNLINKIKDIWNDYIIFYCIDKPKKIYKDIRHWWICCGRYIQHWKFVSFCLFHCYPWDENFFLRIQYEWIKKSNKYFNTKCWCSEEKLKDINRYQKISLGLLEIILDIREYWEYDYDKHEVVMKIPCNLKNKNRFPYRGVNNEELTNMYDNHPEEYYKFKARYLYTKILSYYSINWWD